MIYLHFLGEFKTRHRLKTEIYPPVFRGDGSLWFHSSLLSSHSSRPCLKKSTHPSISFLVHRHFIPKIRPTRFQFLSLFTKSGPIVLFISKTIFDCNLLATQKWLCTLSRGMEWSKFKQKQRGRNKRANVYHPEPQRGGSRSFKMLFTCLGCLFVGFAGSGDRKRKEWNQEQDWRNIL